MKNRKKGCLDCVHISKFGCLCAEECIDYNQWILDEDIIKEEQKKALKIIEEIYSMSAPWSDVVISEDLYNRMESLIEKNE